MSWFWGLKGHDMAQGCWGGMFWLKELQEHRACWTTTTSHPWPGGSRPGLSLLSLPTSTEGSESCWFPPLHCLHGVYVCDICKWSMKHAWKSELGTNSRGRTQKFTPRSTLRPLKKKKKKPFHLAIGASLTPFLILSAVGDRDRNIWRVPLDSSSFSWKPAFFQSPLYHLLKIRQFAPGWPCANIKPALPSFWLPLLSIEGNQILQLIKEKACLFPRIILN